jgi:hypothetical protein
MAPAKNPFCRWTPTGKAVRFCRWVFVRLLKRTIYGASSGGCLRVFETYFAHSPSSASGLLHLLSKFLYFAIDLGLGFVTADNCHDFLCVILGHPRLLSLRERWHGGDQQNSNNELSVHQTVPLRWRPRLWDGLADVRQKEQYRCREKDGEYGHEQTQAHHGSRYRFFGVRSHVLTPVR